MTRKKAEHFDQAVLDIYDEYVHGQIDRRGFLSKAARVTTGAMTAAALLEALSPQYAFASQVEDDDERISTATVEYPSPEGHGTMSGYAAWPKLSDGKLPAVLVIHENRGLNPYIKDVVRRAAIAGFFAFGPDALFPLGGYPGNDDEGRLKQRELDKAKVTQDFIAAAQFLKEHPQTTGAVGAVGFCFGGGMCNQLSVLTPDLIQAAAPFYGRQAAIEDVPKIKAPLMFHFASLDKRVNAGWPAYEAALKEHKKDYVAYMYEDKNHGFHNDTTPRYDKEAAELAWKRTIDFFKEKLSNR
ncbi:dienelactone hydrolase family protein [Puniceicoccaceae bacterium K14]|nr:dienelactone hydrolase family protein [Puniceicoccaceae bacterium K14]